MRRSKLFNPAPNCKCQTCGKLFYKPKCVLKRRRVAFCSKHCRWAGKEVFVVCTGCGKKVRRKPSHVKRQAITQFCSQKCRFGIEYQARRFWDRVRKTGSCWIWEGHISPSGHGTVEFNGQHTGAHRMAWRLLKGPIPDGLNVLHHCPIKDNPACVNPDHLYLGTIADNNRDAWTRGQQRPNCGEKQGGAKLTSKDVLWIRCNCPHRVSIKEAACQFNVAPQTIYYVVNLKSWRHLLPKEAPTEVS